VMRASVPITAITRRDASVICAPCALY
jgi:hypothetical protein